MVLCLLLIQMASLIYLVFLHSSLSRDGGTYMLSHIFDPLLKNTPGEKIKSSGNTKTSGDQVSFSRSGSISVTTSTQLDKVGCLPVDEIVSEKTSVFLLDLAKKRNLILFLLSCSHFFQRSDSHKWIRFLANITDSLRSV